MNVYENMCTICGKALSGHDEYFSFLDAIANNANEIVVCEDCAVKTTVYDLYNRSVLIMANSLDDVIEIDASGIDGVTADNMVPVQSAYGVTMYVDKNAPAFNLVYIYDDSINCYRLRDEIKTLIFSVYDKTNEVWDNTRDRKTTLDYFNGLVADIVRKYGFAPSDFGFPEPAYIRSDGTVGEVDAALLAGGGATQEDAEIYDDVQCMSEEDFASKYADNPAALDEWKKVHGN